jgi:hypothetical protein
VDGHVVYESEVARSTLNPVWVPFQSEGDLLGDAPARGGAPGVKAATLNVQQLLSSGTAFDVAVVRVKERRVKRRPRCKSRSLSRGIVTFDSDDDSWQPSNNSRSFADARGAFDDEDEEEEDDDGASSTVGTSTVGSSTMDSTTMRAITSGLMLPFAARRTHGAEEDDKRQEGEEEEEVLRMTFSVRELEPLPVSVSDITNLPLNTCLFEFASRTFVHRDVVEVLAETGVISGKHSRRKGSAIQLKEYSLHEGVDHLERVLVARAQIAERSKHNEILQEQIRARLALAQRRVIRDQQRAQLEERVRIARAQVAAKRAVLERLRTVMQDERKTFETDIHIPKALLSTMQMSMRYKDEKQGILERRCEVLRAAQKIRSRQAALVQQLNAVYPIEYVASGEYSIRGIRLANSDLSGGSAKVDEEMVSTALGYIAHLVFMLSKYLHVNLRYRVVPYSSRSYLKDEINDPQGDYPLYRKGVERDRHEKAIHYLKKNVEQVRGAVEWHRTREERLLIAAVTAAHVCTKPGPDTRRTHPGATQDTH